MNGPLGIAGSGPIPRFEAREAMGFLPRGWIDGLTLSNDTTDATNDIAVAAGVARSTVNIVDGTASTLTRDQLDMDLPVSIIKQLDVSFAPDNYDPAGYSGGDRSGARSSSNLSDTTWHAYLVGARGIQPDIMLHDSATQSSVLAEMQKIGGYTAYRRIGSVIRASAAIRGFKQDGNYFRLITKGAVTTTNPGTSAVSMTLQYVPTGISVRAIIWAQLRATTTGNAATLYVSALDETDETASGSGAPFGITGPDTFSNKNAGSYFEVMTNTSGAVRTRLSSSAGSDSVILVSLGWIDTRGRDA